MNLSPLATELKSTIVEKVIAPQMSGLNLDVEVELIDEAKAFATGLRCSFCGCCGDFMFCRKCGVSMCLQKEHGATGCIGFSTLENPSEFKCPDCITTGEGSKVINYRVTGYGRRRATPVAWPLLLLRLHPVGMNKHALDVLGDILDYAYLGSKEVCVLLHAAITI
jgi:hypothetical protein